MSDLSTVNPANSRRLMWDVSVLALPLAGLMPLLLLQLMHLWSKSETFLLPFCWLALAAFAFYQRKSITNARWRVLSSYIVLAFALVTGIASVVYFSPWAANLTLAFIFIGWSLVRLTHVSLTRILALSTLLLLSMSLPAAIESRIVSWTNSLVVRACSSVLDLINVFHLYQSPYLAMKEHHFQIAELLGNVFSLQSLVAIAILASLVWERTFLTTLMNVLSALAWALLGKIVFLFITAVFSFNGINITESILGSLILGHISLGNRRILERNFRTDSIRRRRGLSKFDSRYLQSNSLMARQA